MTRVLFASLMLAVSGCALEGGEDIGEAGDYLRPAAPSLISPNGNIASGTAPSYVWNSVAGADRYQVWVKDGIANPRINATVLASDVGCAAGPPAMCTYSPGIVLANGQGHWAVRGISDADGPGPWSPYMFFKVSTTPAPGAISPVGEIVDPNPAYTWSPVSGATSYRVYVRSGGFDPLIDVVLTPAEAGCPGNVGTCMHDSTTSLFTGPGNWAVEARPAAVWSAVLNFSYNTSLMTALISPTGTSSTATPTYVWQRINGAETYRLYVRDSEANPRVDVTLTPAEANCPGTETECSFTPTTAVSPGSVSWYVSINGGPFSGPATFTYGQDLGPATLIAPNGDISDTTPTFSWNAVSGATRYILYVYDAASGFSTPAYTLSLLPADVGCSGGTGTCSITPTTALAVGNGRWTIQTNTGGLFSAYMNFNVLGPCGGGCDDGNACTTDTCGAGGCTHSNDLAATCSDLNPCTTTDACVLRSSGNAVCQATDADRAMCAVSTTNAPVGAITTYTPTYSWNAVTGVPTYRLYVWRLTAGVKVAIIDQIFDATTACSGGTCTATPSTAVANGESYWAVQTPPHNDGELPQQHGPWSGTKRFWIGISTAPTLVAPTGTLTVNPPTFQWNAVTGTGHVYDLYIYAGTTLVSNVQLSESSVGCSMGMGTCMYTPPATLPTGSGRFTVRANPADSPGEMSGPYAPYMNYTVP